MPTKPAQPPLLPDQCHAYLLRHLSDSIGLLEGASPNETEPIHKVRRTCKKLRALCRILESVDPEQAADLRGKLRDAARIVSDIRDRDARRESLEWLLLRSKRFRSATEQLHSPIPLFTEEPRSDIDARAMVDRFLVALREARNASQSLRLDALSHLDLRQGIQDSYRKARQAMRRFALEPTAGNLHVWRKRVKDLNYHLQMTSPFLKRRARSFQRSLDRLGERLGRARDLYLFELALVALESSSPHRDQIQLLEAACRRKREGLERRAKIIGERILRRRATRIVPELFRT